LAGQRRFHVRPQPQNRLGFELGHAGFMQVHDGGDLAQRELLVVVERQHVWRSTSGIFEIAEASSFSSSARSRRFEGQSCSESETKLKQVPPFFLAACIFEAADVNASDLHQPLGDISSRVRSSPGGHFVFVGARCRRCSAALMAASIRLAFLRFCRGAQSSSRRLSRIAPRILYSAYVFQLHVLRRVELVDRP